MRAWRARTDTISSLRARRTHAADESTCVAPRCARTRDVCTHLRRASVHTLTLDFGFRGGLAPSSPSVAVPHLPPHLLSQHIERCVPAVYGRAFLHRDADIPPFPATHAENQTCVGCLVADGFGGLTVLRWWMAELRRVWRELPNFAPDAARHPNVGDQMVTDCRGDVAHARVALPAASKPGVWSLRASTTLRTLHVYEKAWALGDFDWVLPPTLRTLRLHDPNLFAEFPEGAGDFGGVRLVELCRSYRPAAPPGHYSPSYTTLSPEKADDDETLASAWQLPLALRTAKRRLL